MGLTTTPAKLFRPRPVDELLMLEKISLKDPCTRAQSQFDSNGTRRSMNLSMLKADKGFCVWCDGPLTGRKQRWCSEECVGAAVFRAFPQSPGAKVYRLIHDQNWACKLCGVSFEDDLRKRIARRWETENREGSIIWDSSLKRMTTRLRTADDPEYKVSYSYVGDNTGHLFQTDHVHPIHKGGAGIDPKNLQVICVPCHKNKTRDDLSRT